MPGKSAQFETSSNITAFSPYSSRWPDEFRAVAAPLRGALGNLALRIDHIGSTSIPGLCAKDVIDLQITVTSLDDFALSDTLVTAGFSARPDITQDHPFPDGLGSASDWRKRYFREARCTRQVHIHVRETGKPNQRYAILFRDYLRVQPGAAFAYSYTKAATHALLAAGSLFGCEGSDLRFDHSGGGTMGNHIELAGWCLRHVSGHP